MLPHLRMFFRSWRSTILWGTLAFLLMVTTTASAVAQEIAGLPKIQGVIGELDKPFLFGYLSWQDKVQTKVGIAIVRNVDNRGGVGINANLDLSEFGNASPAIRINIGTGNHQGITWPITWVIGKAMKPSAYEWPTHEAYWDLGGWPMLEEFTVDNWAPNVLVWGYLAGRNQQVSYQ